jgi:hypothetical protein
MLRAALIALACTFAAGTFAQPVQQAPATSPENKASAKQKSKKPTTGPVWADLSAAQQQILAPLRNDWDSLEPDSKRRWIRLAKRYPKMKPESQARVQKRMQKWASLSPEQRQQARENYRRIAKERAEKRKLRKRWEEYQALSPEERRNLAPPPEPAPSKKKQR